MCGDVDVRVCMCVCMCLRLSYVFVIRCLPGRSVLRGGLRLLAVVRYVCSELRRQRCAAQSAVGRRQGPAWKVPLTWITAIEPGLHDASRDMRIACMQVR